MRGKNIASTWGILTLHSSRWLYVEEISLSLLYNLYIYIYTNILDIHICIEYTLFQSILLFKI